MFDRQIAEHTAESTKNTMAHLVRVLTARKSRYTHTTAVPELHRARCCDPWRMAGRPCSLECLPTKMNT